jgi:hypothetical protein
VNQSQKEFEIWLASEKPSIPDAHVEVFERLFWYVWQASRAALAVELPCWSEYDTPRQYMDAVRQRLDELGISHTSR